MSFNIVEIDNDKIGVEHTGNKTFAVDLQGVDKESMKNRGESLPVSVTEKEFVVYDVVESLELRDSDNGHGNILKKENLLVSDFDVIITNTLDVDVSIGFNYTGNLSSEQTGRGEISVEMESGDFKFYNTSGPSAKHVIKAGARNVLLSSIQAADRDGTKTIDIAPFKKILPLNNVNVLYRAADTPSEGALSITYVGVV